MLPSQSPRKPSTRDLIISILGDQWPLSAKEISTRLGKKSDAQVSYQAVHKLLAQLCEEKVLEKSAGRYQLAKAWIADVKQFITSLENKYESKETFLAGIAEFKNSFEFTFHDVTDFALSMAEMLVSERFVTSKGGYRVAALRHGWWTLRFNFDQFLLLKKISRLLNKPYCIIKKDSPFVRWLNKQYTLAGFRPKTVDGLEGPDDDILICGSLIVQVNYSKETKKIIDELYAKIFSLTDLFKHYAVSTRPEEKAEIRFKITDNPALAATLGKHYMDIWNSR